MFVKFAADQLEHAEHMRRLLAFTEKDKVDVKTGAVCDLSALERPIHRLVHDKCVSFPKANRLQERVRFYETCPHVKN